jgi:hypothetical protein
VPTKNSFFRDFYLGEVKFVKEKNRILEIYHSEGFLELGYLLAAYAYVSTPVELDPRLSEVNRWWLDQTAPNCEIIKDQVRAEEILKLFLEELNIAEEYKLTQDQFKYVMKIAKVKGIEDEIYEKLGERLPGLAYEDSNYWDLDMSGGEEIVA